MGSLARQLALAALSRPSASTLHPPLVGVAAAQAAASQQAAEGTASTSYDAAAAAAASASTRWSHAGVLMQRRGMSRLTGESASNSASSDAAAASSAPLPQPLDPDVSAKIQAAFQDAPCATAQQLSDLLPPSHRGLVMGSLASDEKTYISRLFKAADTHDDDGKLSEEEFRRALHLHRTAETAQEGTPPSSSALRICFLASAIPFVTFGFLDNSIMLFAGEEIDNVFGIRFGLSTLASAGLGNTFADIIGVSAASGIETASKKLPFIKNSPKLSRAQAQMRSTRVTKALGASCGVTVGCIIGLLPLWFSGSFFVPR